MKKALLTLVIVSCLTGCSSMYKVKKTEFYKDQKLVKTFIGRGVFDASEWFGTYKIWAKDDWKFYEYKCEDCEVVETIIEEKK